ncbi:MAG TPA: group 1 truncated hemoglobin [Sphingomicrobium sp.]|nr:group 1 truncated hemoglobin [Sphingomicrobium sp.]
MIKEMMPLAAAALVSASWAGVAVAHPGHEAPVPAKAIAATAQSATAPSQAKKPASLYDRLGGIFAIAAVVDRFSDAIIANPKLNKNPALVEWNQQESATRLPGLKFMRTLWVASLAGGPFDYTGLPLPVAHKRFALTPEEFDEVGAEIVRALDFYKVPEKEKQELVGAYMKSKPQVVSGAGAQR